MMRDFILFATLDRVHMEITYCFCVYGERNGYYKLNLDITYVCVLLTMLQALGT